MIFAGGKLLWMSVEQILHPEELNTGLFTIFVLGCSIAAKLFLGLFYRRAARKISSEAINAAAVDSFTDCLATSVVLISVVVYNEFDINIDGGAGVFISAFILRGGFSALKEILTPLLGGIGRPRPDCSQLRREQDFRFNARGDAGDVDAY